MVFSCCGWLVVLLVVSDIFRLTAWPTFILLVPEDFRECHLRGVRGVRGALRCAEFGLDFTFRNGSY